MLAALTPDKGRDIATFMKNLAMMRNLCNGLARSGCAHLVYFSSDAVYDSSVSVVTEDTPASPQTLYGAMHLAREIMARSIAALPLLILRPTGVYGSGDTHNAYGPNRFRRSAREARRIALFGGGEEMRDHIYIDDVGLVTLRCLLHRTTGTLNLAAGRSMTFHRIAALVAAAEHAGVEIAQTPRTEPITHRHYDVTRLIKLFPDFSPTSVEDGIRRTARPLGESDA
jgi:UDP-glucose 4-epimerase